MNVFRSMWRRLRGGRDDERASEEGIDRRTVLMGAAATAGVVAASASPAITGSASAATATSATGGATFAVAQTGTIPASQVTYTPTGEITNTDVQSVLSVMDQRLSKVRMFDDLQVALTLVDEFMGNTATSGTIGQLGWALPAGATGTVGPAVGANELGVFVIGTGTTATGWHGINLGSNNLVGSPVFMCEWRVKLSNLNRASDKFSCWFGLHNATNAAEPSTGFYFRYTPSNTTWFAACADGGTPNAVSTGVVADLAFHRFRITCDGAGVARFYIDDAQVALLLASLPSTNSYSPNLIVAKSTGTAARNARVDYFALRYERAR